MTSYPHTLRNLSPLAIGGTIESVDPVIGFTEQWDRKVYNDVRHALGVGLRDYLPAAKDLRFRTGYTAGRRPGRLIHAEFVPGAAVADGMASVYISPSLSDPRAIVLATLRETIRAAVYAECAREDTRPEKRVKIYGAKLREYGITKGGKVDETPECDADLLGKIDKALVNHGARPHSAIAHDAKMVKVGKTYDLKCECPECGNIVRKTDTKIKQDWPTCSGSGTHVSARRLFMTVTDTSGNLIDIMSSGHVANPSVYVTDNGDGTFSPTF